MKQNMKRVLLVLCMVTCLFSLSACSNKADQEETIDPMKQTILEQSATAILQQLNEMTDEDLTLNISQAEKDKDPLSLGGLQSWESAKTDLGALISIDSTKVHVTDEGYMVEVKATYAQRTMTFNAGIDEEMTQFTSWSFTPDFSVGEKMEKAALNTLMGMGTVFCVLIFISLIIGCFRYINAWETNKKNNNQSAPAAPVPAQAAFIPEEVDLTDDMELVAVITAAIAASAVSAGGSADGLVVRSIRRASAGKWKKA